MDTEIRQNQSIFKKIQMYLESTSDTLLFDILQDIFPKSSKNFVQFLQTYRIKYLPGT